MPLAGRLVRLRVDLDEAALGKLDTGFLEPHVFDVRRATGGDEHSLGLELLLLGADFDGHLRRTLRDLHVRDLGARENVDAPLLERSGDSRRAVGVLEWQNRRHHFDERDLGAIGVEHVGELAADGAGANDDHRFRRALERQHLVGRQHGLLVELEPDLRQPLHARSGRDHDRFFRVVLFFLSVRGLYRHGLAAGEPAGALDPRDLVLLEQRLDTLRVLRTDTAGALHGWPVVELHVPECDPVLSGVLDLVRQRRALEQRFRWDAPPEHAGTAEPLALDDGG